MQGENLKLIADNVCKEDIPFLKQMSIYDPFLYCVIFDRWQRM